MPNKVTDPAISSYVAELDPLAHNELKTLKPDAIDESAPHGDELESILFIRKEASVLVRQLKYPTEDVVGDWRILRFVRNSKGDKKKALKNYQQFMKHRLDHNHLIEELGHEVRGMSPDEFTKWYQPRANPFMPVCPYAGESDQGEIYFWINQGNCDFNQFVNNRPDGMPLLDDLAVMIQCHEWLLWRLNVMSVSKNKLCYITKLMDFHNLADFPCSQTREYLRVMTALMGVDYCEGDRHFLALRTPAIFNLIYAMMKVFMTTRQRKKIQILSKIGTLSQHVPTSSVIPVRLGGTLEDILVYPDTSVTDTLFQKRVALRKDWVARYPKKMADLK